MKRVLFLLLMAVFFSCKKRENSASILLKVNFIDGTVDTVSVRGDYLLLNGCIRHNRGRAIVYSDVACGVKYFKEVKKVKP